MWGGRRRAYLDPSEIRGQKRRKSWTRCSVCSEGNMKPISSVKLGGGGGVLAALIRPRTAWARRPAGARPRPGGGGSGSRRPWSLRPGEQGDPAEYTKKHQVEQAYGHRSHPAGAQAPVPAKPQIRLCDTVTGTHTARGRYPRSTGPGAQPGGRTPPFRINSHAGESRCLPPSR